MRFLAAIILIIGIGFSALKCATHKSGKPGFFFGVSNAAFQVEGSIRDSDWREWTLTDHPDGTPRISDKTNAERGTREIRKLGTDTYFY